MASNSKVFAVAVVGLAVVVGLIATVLSKIYKDSSKIPEPNLTKEMITRKNIKKSLPHKKLHQKHPTTHKSVQEIQIKCLPKETDSDTTDEEEFYDAPSTLDVGDSGLPQELQENPALRDFVKTIDDLNVKLPADQKYAHTLLEKRKQEFGSYSEYLWRLARSYRNLATVEEKKGCKKEEKAYILQAFEYATRALEINRSSAIIHKWYAILCGKRGDYLSINERIQCGHKFKEHIDIAVQLNPKDFGLHYLLGRFFFEVAQLPWIMRVAAKTLFGEVPMATIDEAVASFQESERLLPWKDNRVFLSRCYFKLNQKKQGQYWLLKAHEMPITSVDDEMADKLIQELSKKHSVVLPR